jgi:4-amino-4-deoxy-L-arabinose transferase-like glycosyltransferase
VAVLLLILAFAGLLRFIYPTADPPSEPTVGIVWHDEGAWVHNARNRALFGTWRTDEWNPMYINPVFTGFEYLSFRLFGVGLAQARLVSQVAGLAAVLLVGLGVARMTNRLAGLIAAGLLATSYVSVMYDRAALMESLMVAWLVAGWYCYIRAAEAPRWGFLAGACAVIAFFTKASAVFFIAALAVDAVVTSGSSLTRQWPPLRRSIAGMIRNWTGRDPTAGDDDRVTRAALFTLIGLAAAGLVALAVFVLPNWTEYRFYNWQMSVTRKPAYDLRAFIDRASWLPIIHDFFTRVWFVTILAAGAGLSMLLRWRRLHPGERLLVLWVGLGVAELIVHDTGNERRFVFLIPACVALAAALLGRDRRLLPPEAAELSRRWALTAAPLLLFTLFVLWGAVLRLPFIYETRPGVRLSALAAVVTALAIYATWPAAPRWIARQRWSPAASILLASLIVAGNLAQFVQWARIRSSHNYTAMVELRRLLPPDTLVHGKLANGMALENRIRPIFVGRGFGNYADRTMRDDVPYILTYVAPYVGYEGPVIRDVLEAYPDRRMVWTFEVAETPARDMAALFEKWPGSGSERQAGTGRGRAHD